jgi:hypothetical protein
MAAALPIQSKPDLSKLVQSLTPQELTRLLETSMKEQTERQHKTQDCYGKYFCDLVGLEQLYQLPEVSAQEMSLADDPKYPENTVLPSHLKATSAVRGIMGSNRPFIAVKIELLNPTTKKVVDVVVEVIFKRYALDGDGGKGHCYENNYVTALHNKSEGGQTYRSTLYSSGGMITAQIQVLRDLLAGKEIQAPIGNYLIRKAK